MNENQTKPIKPIELMKVGYYSTKIRKLLDFSMGLMEAIILFVIYTKIDGKPIFGSLQNTLIITIIGVLLYIMSTIYFFIIKRKFISIGLLVAVPLIILFLFFILVWFFTTQPW